MGGCRSNVWAMRNEQPIHSTSTHPLSQELIHMANTIPKRVYGARATKVLHVATSRTTHQGIPRHTSHKLLTSKHWHYMISPSSLSLMNNVIIIGRVLAWSVIHFHNSQYTCITFNCFTQYIHHFTHK
jgi:hypothetical protein